MNRLVELKYPCPLCGGKLFSIFCRDIGRILEKTEKCVVISKHPERYEGCSIFCLFQCRGEEINMYNSEEPCEVINKRILRKFKLFSSIPFEKGFKI